jgi:hypothetical protein
MPNMGIGFASSVVFKRQNRFIMHIPDVTHVGNSSVRIYNKVLLEEKSARPKLSYKEIEVNHVIETIRFAGRPEWDNLQVSLYDVAQSNPAWGWITSNYYLRKMGNSNQVGIGYLGGASGNFKRNVQIFMLDGCGYAIEAWNYVNAYPVAVDWGEVSMGSSDAMRINMTLRYDRAYWEACSRNIISIASQYMIP